MKMTLKLSYEEGTAVLDALRKVAHDGGWSDDEIESSDVMDVYASVLDAALNALGIEVLISNTPTPDEDETEEVDTFGVPVDYESDFDEDEDEEEDEDEDEEEEDETDIPKYKLTLKGQFIVLCLQHDVPWNEAVEMADAIFPNQSEPDYIEQMITERNGHRCLQESTVTVLKTLFHRLVAEDMRDATQKEQNEMVDTILMCLVETYKITKFIAGE